MVVIGLLVKGPHGEEYLVTGESEIGDGPTPFRIFLREPQGWVLTNLSTDAEARLRAEAMIGVYKLARQFGVGVPWPPQGPNQDAPGH
ncbi:MAG: hypothetical protein LZF86_110452 [Nitrospira sp.]|nr:MAG: hypothetical protein LZF86_110452 [Nitrospira sp.]